MVSLRFFDQFPEPGNPQSGLDWKTFGIDPETVAYAPDLAPPEINLAGGIFELDPRDTYTIGRGFKGEDGKLCLCSFALSRAYPLSRVHATIRYCESTDTWEVLDGGRLWLNGRMVYKPSDAGVFVDGDRLSPRDAKPIGPGSKISLGLPCAKIVVMQSTDETLVDQVWAPPGWPNLIKRWEATEEDTRGEYRPMNVYPADAVQQSEPLTGLAGLAEKLWVDLRQTPATRQEAAWQLLLLAFVSGIVAVVAIAILR